MQTQTPLVLVIGIVLGIAVGFGFSELLREPADLPGGLDAAEGLDEGGEPEEAIGLAGRPDASTEGTPGAKLSEKGASLLTEFEATGFKDEATIHEAWIALAKLYALSGREEDVLRVLDFAVEAGAGLDSIVGILWSIPAASRVAALDALIERHPNAEWDDATLAYKYNEFGATARAVELARRAMERGAEGGPNWGLLSILLAGDPDSAPGFLMSLARANTWSSESLEYLADNLIEHELKDAALPFVLLGLEQDPLSDGLLLSLAGISKEDAIRWAEGRVRKDPRDTEAWGRLGGWRLEEGDHAAAFEAYAAAVRYDPKSEWLFELMKMDAARALPLISKTTAGVVDDEAIGMLAKTLMMTGDRKGALEVYMRAHDRDPADAEWLQGMVRLDPQTALEVLAPRVTPSPRSADDDMVGAYAKALLELGQDEKAWEYFHHAFERDSSDPEWKIFLARIDARRALPLLEEGYSDGVTDASKVGPLGVAYASTGQTTKARRFLEMAIEHDDYPTKWYRELGRLDPGLVESRLKEKIEAEPENATYYASLGYVYLDQGRRTDALAAFEKALSLSDSYTWRLEATLLQSGG